MKIENAKVTLTFDDPNEILEGMDGFTRMRFYQSLSCHDEIIEHVMEQVFEGWTADGYHGSIVCDWNGNSELQKFKKKMIEVTADHTTKQRIEELESACFNLESENGYLKNELEELRK